MGIRNVLLRNKQMFHTRLTRVKQPLIETMITLLAIHFTHYQTIHKHPPTKLRNMFLPSNTTADSIITANVVVNATNEN